MNFGIDKLKLQSNDFKVANAKRVADLLLNRLIQLPILGELTSKS